MENGPDLLPIRANFLRICYDSSDLTGPVTICKLRLLTTGGSQSRCGLQTDKYGIRYLSLTSNSAGHRRKEVDSSVCIKHSEIDLYSKILASKPNWHTGSVAWNSGCMRTRICACPNPRLRARLKGRRTVFGCILTQLRSPSCQCGLWDMLCIQARRNV